MRKPIVHQTVHHTGLRVLPQDDRFWTYVDWSGGEEACWPWTGYRDKQGYGKVMREGNNVFAHRWAWRLLGDPIPEGVVIRHMCDNPPCCNPTHLMSGTQKDNIRDRQERGRHRPGRFPGEAHHNARLTDADIRAIREARANGESIVSLSKRYGMSYHWMSEIIHRRAWSHVA